MSNFALYALWLLLPPLQGAIAYRMWQKKSYRDYPIFFAYTLEQLARFAVLFYWYQLHASTRYMHAYASFQAIEAILQIGIVCELYSDVFRPYEGIRHFGPSFLRWSSVSFLFLAIVVAAYSTGADSYKFLGNLFALERSLEIVQAGLLVTLVVASSILALQWKPRTLGIALGFGLFTAVNLIAYTVRFELGMSTQHSLSLICNAAYDCSVLIWVWALYAVPKVVPELERRAADWDPQPWNEALSEYLQR
jgi:hypothetical protein